VVNVSRVVFILLLMMLLTAGAHAGSVEGRLAYRKGDYSKALREFGDGTQAGPVGAFFLSLMQLRGEGLPKNEVRGIELLSFSAEEGYSAAQYLLGQKFLYGRGVKKDKGAALSYLLAASPDDYRAVALLKIIEKGSQGEKKDRERVVAEVKRKAKNGDPQAQYTLALMYLVGDGVPKDGVEEVRWYRAAAARNARSAFMLSLMYQHGEGVPNNPVEAFRFMKLAAMQHDFRAQYYLGTYYYNGTGSPIDRVAAAAWFRSSAEGGFADAQLAYGMVLLSGDGIPQDKGQAVEWLSKAAQQNNARAKEVVRELLTYSSLPLHGELLRSAKNDVNTEKRQIDGSIRLEGTGVILDEGTFGLKFSLPTLHDAYAPQNQNNSKPLWDKLQGGTLDIIIRTPK
jgi:TPR repeat protein